MIVRVVEDVQVQRREVAEAILGEPRGEQGHQEGFDLSASCQGVSKCKAVEKEKLI